MTHKKDKGPLEPTDLKEPVTDYVRAKQIPTFFGQLMLKGKTQEIDLIQFDTKHPEQYYSHPNGLGMQLFGCARLRVNPLILFLPIPPTTSRRQSGIHLSLKRNMSRGLCSGFKKQREYSNRLVVFTFVASLKFWQTSSCQLRATFQDVAG